MASSSISDTSSPQKRLSCGDNHPTADLEGAHGPKTSDHGDIQNSRNKEQNDTPSAPGATFTFPDGGLEAWLVVLGGWLALFCTFGLVNCFGVFQTHYETNQLAHKSSSDISWIGSVQVCIMFFCGIFTGHLFDAGYFRHLIMGGSVLFLVGVFMLSLCKSYYQFFLAQSICMGIGMGCIFLPAMAVVGHWWKKRRYIGFGIVATGSSIGGVILPIILNRLFPRIGFGWTVRVVAFISLGCLGGTCLMQKARIPPREDGALYDISAIKDVPFMMFVIGAFLTMWGLFTPFFFMESFGIAHGISRNLAFYSLPITNAGSIIGRTVPNMLADRHGALNLMIPCVVATGALVFSWFGATNIGGYIVFCLLFGIFSGAYVGLLTGVIASLSPSIQVLGKRVGMAFQIISIAALTGSPIAGALIKGSDFSRMIIFTGVVIFSGACFMTLSRILKVGTSLSAKV